MSNTQGDDGDSTGGDRTRAMAELRAAVLLLANDDCTASHQLADQIISNVDAFRSRMQWHRSNTAMLAESHARLESENMAKHRHRPVESRTSHGNYMGPLSGRFMNPAARGDRTRTDFCRCGGKRYTNIKGGQQEIGRWHVQLNLNLKQENEKKRPPQTDGRSLSKCYPTNLPPCCNPNSPEARRSTFKVV